MYYLLYLSTVTMLTGNLNPLPVMFTCILLRILERFIFINYNQINKQITKQYSIDLLMYYKLSFAWWIIRHFKGIKPQQFQNIHINSGCSEINMRCLPFHNTRPHIPGEDWRVNLICPFQRFTLLWTWIKLFVFIVVSPAFGGVILVHLVATLNVILVK